jgi:hypothetical protein
MGADSAAATTVEAVIPAAEDTTAALTAGAAITVEPGDITAALTAAEDITARAGTLAEQAITADLAAEVGNRCMPVPGTPRVRVLSSPTTTAARTVGENRCTQVPGMVWGVLHPLAIPVGWGPEGLRLQRLHQWAEAGATALRHEV